MAAPARTRRSSTEDTAELASRLRLSATRLARQLRQQASTGLTPTQYSTLVSIDRHGPVTLGELAEHERVAAPTITKAVTKLEAAGLVAKQADPEDRRFCHVQLTGDGRALLDETRQRRDAWLAVRLDALDATERARLAAALDALDHLTDGTP
jgi:DNA-binding MarR family transcriptional regulator